MNRKEMSDALDATLTGASREWLQKWVDTHHPIVLRLPTAEGNALLKEASTHSYVGQILTASPSFKTALRKLEHGTRTIPQMQLETLMFNHLNPLVLSPHLTHG